MTRINTNPVYELVDEHLIAEYRELPRIFSMVAKAQKAGKNINNYNIPPKFLLGSGHMKFFSNKLSWLRKRHKEIVLEMYRRGFNVNFPSPKIPPSIGLEWYNGWQPTETDMDLSRNRIKDRISNSKKVHHYYGHRL